MARDILSEYGPDRRANSGSVSGGVTRARDVMNYSAPKGPMGINNPQSPGLHGENIGSAGTQGKGSASSSGSPGLHGTNKGNSGSQR